MTRHLASKVFFGLLFLGVSLTFSRAWADDEETFYCEVLSVEGPVYLNNSSVYGKVVAEGDLLQVDDEIETGEGGSAELAFDKDWSNTTRVEANSRVKLKAVFPTRLYLDKGALYAKLKSLPKDSAFQIETPTAIAAVRGTEYRTEYTDGETVVSNDSEKETSQVYIYDPDDAGELRGEPVVLPRTQFTGVPAGAKPRPAQKMSENQRQLCQKARGVLDNRIQQNIARGRVSKIQDIQAMENFGRKMNERSGGERNKSQRMNDGDRKGGFNSNPPGGSGPGNGNRGNRDGQSFNRGGEGNRFEGNQPNSASPDSQSGDRPQRDMDRPMQQNPQERQEGQGGMRDGQQGQQERRGGGSGGNQTQKNNSGRPGGAKPRPRR